MTTPAGATEPRGNALVELLAASDPAADDMRTPTAYATTRLPQSATS